MRKWGSHVETGMLSTERSPSLTFSQAFFSYGRTTCILLCLADAIPKTPNTVPSEEAVTVQQQQMPLNGKDRTFVLPVQNFEQNYMPPDSSSPENTSLEGSDTRK